MMIETWTPHGPSLDNLMFSKEVEYSLLVAGATEEQKDRYVNWIFLALKKGGKWPLLCPLFFYSLAHQLTYNQYREW